MTPLSLACPPPPPFTVFSRRVSGALHSLCVGLTSAAACTWATTTIFFSGSGRGGWRAAVAPAGRSSGQRGAREEAEAAGAAVSRAFPSWKRSVSTEIYLCHACSYHAIEDGNARTGRPSSARSSSARRSCSACSSGRRTPAAARRSARPPPPPPPRRRRSRRRRARRVRKAVLPAAGWMSTPR
eukprot:COSAG01_NODE_56_length_31088_cov_39.354771_11_plen_184_part_00